MKINILCMINEPEERIQRSKFIGQTQSVSQPILEIICIILRA